MATAGRTIAALQEQLAQLKSENLELQAVTSSTESGALSTMSDWENPAWVSTVRVCPKQHSLKNAI
jgi:hypothetical protein